MLTPINYVDLFDRLFPEQHLVGLSDDSQINVEELNHRYATIRANQRTMMLALNSIYSSSPDGFHFRDFMLPYWEVEISKTFELNSAKISSLRFQTGYDPGGNVLSFSEVRIGLHLNDLGSDLINSSAEVLVFVGGLLISSVDYHIHISQGGFSVYIKESKIPANSTSAHVIILRKFNELERTRCQATVYKNENPNITTPYDVIIPSLADLGNVYDIRYYKLFHKLPGDSYFRPVLSDVGSRILSEHEGFGAVFTKMDGALANEEFIIVCTAEFWKYEFHGPVTEDTSVPLINLIDKYDQPAPIWCIEDVDVWLNGRHLRANVDYWLQFGGEETVTHPPRLVLRNVPTGSNQDIVVISNAPYDPELYPDIQAAELPNPYGIFRLLDRDHEFKLLQNIGLVYSGGHLTSVADNINVIGDNIGFHFAELPDTRDFFFKARFVLTRSALEGAMRESNYQTALEKFFNLVGIQMHDNPNLEQVEEYCFDFINSYRINFNLTPVSTNYHRPFDPIETFHASYYWVRDEQNLDRARGKILDCRPTTVEDLKFLVPWMQIEDQSEVVFDCREPVVANDLGYITNRTLDCRNI
jgi:hypothetical protein